MHKTMENPINITMLNDFIFCPASIYYHSLDSGTDEMLFKSDKQLNGTKAHQSIDNQNYSDKINTLQGISVYSEKYNLYGKIDLFYTDTKTLVERKRKINNIYDGYIFQLYSQYFCLKEMGYNIENLQFYSMMDNKKYDINLPEDNFKMVEKYEELLSKIKNFNIENFKQSNYVKCENCIYEELCCYSAIKE